jgi:hypothetical protein
MLIAAPPAATYAVPFAGTAEKGGIVKAEIIQAAAACGTRVVVVDLPAATPPPVKAAFGYNLDPRATDAQRQCFYKKVPSTRVGFITSPPDPSSWTLLSPKRKATLLDTISRKCRVPRSWFIIKGQSELHLRPSRDGKPSQVECALRLLRPYNPFLGLVGNETYDPEIK